jgi:hypothetical protein
MLSHYAALLALALFGCMPPDVLRTPHVASPGKRSFNVKSSYSVAPATLTWSEGPSGGTATSSGTISGNSSDLMVTASPAAVVLPLGSVEVGAAIGLFRPCEFGFRFGFFAAGAEARCEPLDARRGAPLSLALSLGGGFEPWIRAGYFRGGVDLALTFGNWEPLLGAYIRRGARRYALYSDELPARPSEHCCPTGLEGLEHDRSVWIDRAELRLALPVGVGYTLPPRRVTRHVRRIVFGVVPSFELSGDSGASDCTGCADDVEVQVTSFENAFVVTAVVGFEWGTD